MELDFLNLFLVLLTAWLAGNLANRLGYPSVLGELLVGVLLGPPLLGLLHGSEALNVLAEFGVLLMMLYIGMEIDPEELKKASWSGIVSALGGFITPFVLAYLLVVWMGGTPLVGIFVGLSAGITSLAVNSRILLDLRVLDTRVAHVMMAGALVADTLSLILFAAVLGVVEVGNLDLTQMALVALKAILFFGITAFFGVKVFPYVGRLLTEAGLTARTFLFTLVLIIAVFFGELAELAGLHAILGAFIAGLFLRDNVLGRTLSHDLMEAVRDTSIGMLTPIFFVTAGFAVSFNVFETDLGLFLAVVVIAALGKMLGTALFYLPSGYGWREALVIGAGMNGRGGVDIIIAGIALEMGVISQNIFSILVFMAILTTLGVPAMLKRGIAWLRERGELVRSGDERSGTVIIGAGPLARALAQVLGKTQDVWLVDSNEDHCEAGKQEGLQAVYGNALQEQILSDAKAAQARALIALTPNIEVNTLAAQMARGVFSIPEVYLVQTVAQTGKRHETLHHIQATSLFAGPVPLEEWDHQVGHQETRQSILTLSEPTSPAMLMKRLQEEQSSLPLALLRDQMYLPFHGQSTLVKGDQVVVLSPQEEVVPKHDRFDQLVSTCPIYDLKEVLSMEAFFGVAAEALAPRVEIESARLAEMLLESEAYRSTVIAPGLAIPHLSLEGEGHFHLLIARSRNGIAFPGQEVPVKTIFVLAGTPDDRNFHLRVLSAIAQIVQDDTFERKWATAKGAEALRQLLLNAERRRFEEPESRFQEELL